LYPKKQSKIRATAPIPPIIPPTTAPTAIPITYF